jgi:hypothetical protein
MNDWHTNTGQKPHRAPEDGPPIQKVFVRLRCGARPAEPWPVDTGRVQTTRWTLRRDSHDILEWREG